MTPDDFINDCEQLEKFARTINVSSKGDKMRLDYVLAEYRTSISALVAALKKERA